MRLFPIQVIRLRARTRDCHGRHAVPVTGRFLTCTFCQGDQNDSITCTAYDKETYGDLVGMQNHLRAEHLGPECQGDENYYAFRAILQGHSEHVFSGAYMYFLADGRAYLFAGLPGQYQEWLKWTAAGSPPLSAMCHQGHHRRCYGIVDDGTSCGCPRCNHPEKGSLSPQTQVQLDPLLDIDVVETPAILSQPVEPPAATADDDDSYSPFFAD